MSTVLLRTLALKSKLGFGKYPDYRIEQLIALRKQPYLRWLYFNASNISFMPEILLMIGLLEKEFIPKPGVDRDAAERIMKNSIGHLATRIGAEEATKSIAKIRRKSKKAAIGKRIYAEQYVKSQNSKARLQARNHGRS